MSRQRTKLRKKKAGIHVPGFKSRSSPSYYKSREKYRKEKTIGKPYCRHHAKRTKLKRQLVEELGLPIDTKFIFRYSIIDRPLERPAKILIDSGTVVVINKKDLSIVLIVRCTPFQDMDMELRKKYDHSLSTTFLHARARNQCKIHSSLQKGPLEEGEEEEEPLCGWMGCTGWRGGCEKDKSAGPYSLNSFTSANIGRIQTDKERMEEFHRIRDFWADRFSTCSLKVFKTNVALALKAKVPGFHELKWQLTPNGLVFASNLVVTCDGFHNHSHTDKDHTRYAFGMWGLIIRSTGEPYDKEKGIKIGKKEGVKLGDVRGARFCIDSFGIEVDLGGCNGINDVLWDTTIPHYTTSSIAYDGQGTPIEHKKSKVTLYGSSCQISEALVHRIKLLGDKKEGMTDSQWKNHCDQRVKTYEQMFDDKVEKATKKLNLKLKKGVESERNA